MRHIKKFKKESTSPDLSKYAPARTKDCESRCDREVIMTKDGPVVVCNACDRIVMDNRK